MTGHGNTPVLRPHAHDLWPQPGSQCGSNPAARWIHSDPANAIWARVLVLQPLETSKGHALSMVVLPWNLRQSVQAAEYDQLIDLGQNAFGFVIQTTEASAMAHGLAMKEGGHAGNGRHANALRDH